MPRRYSPREISLRLSQDDTGDFLLELRNETSVPITNLFSQGLFEGKFVVVQMGHVPAEANHKDYFDIVLHGLRIVPPCTIEPNAGLRYRVPLQDLVFLPLACFQPDPDNRLLVYAFMEGGFDITSNAIELKHRERIDWRPWRLTLFDSERALSRDGDPHAVDREEAP